MAPVIRLAGALPEATSLRLRSIWTAIFTVLPDLAHAPPLILHVLDQWAVVGKKCGLGERPKERRCSNPACTSSPPVKLNLCSRCPAPGLIAYCGTACQSCAPISDSADRCRAHWDVLHKTQCKVSCVDPSPR